MKYDANGNLLATFNPDVSNGAGGYLGVGAIALALDQCTIDYILGTSIKQFDTCANIQLLDLVTSLPNSFGCSDLRRLPNGQILIACQGSYPTGQVYLVNTDGSIAQTYMDSSYGGGQFDWLALDPGGLSFWTASETGASAGTFYHIDAVTGNLLGTFSTTIDVAGLTVFGAAGSSPPVHPIIFVHGIGQNSSKIGVPQPDPSDNKFVPLYQEIVSEYGSSNVITFAYVDDRSLADANGGSCPSGIYPPCQSQSAVLDNAISLAAIIRRAVETTNHAVTLIGYSMGGAIIRTALAGCPDGQGNFFCADAPTLVESAFFLTAVQQGSWVLKARQGIDAVSALPVVGPAANALANLIYQGIQLVTGLNPGYPAEKDLAPQSDNIKAHNAALPPIGIQYFTSTSSRTSRCRCSSDCSSSGKYRLERSQ